MLYEFEVYQMEVESHLFWVAKSKQLTGCVGQGETAQEAIDELTCNEQDWLETAKIVGIPIPQPRQRQPKQYSGKVSLRFSPAMHELASNIANEQGISLNQYINDAIVFYNGVNSAPPKETSSSVVSILDYKQKKYSVKAELEEM